MWYYKLFSAWSHSGDKSTNVCCISSQLNYGLNCKAFSEKVLTNLEQGCQLPDFSLRSQTFFILQTFPRHFLYMPKTITFSHFITKQPASTLEFQYFYSILQMNFYKSRQKQEEGPFFAGTSCAWAGPWPVVTRTLSTSRSSQTFFKHNFGNPGSKFVIV